MLCLAGNEDGGLTVWDTSGAAMDILLELEGHKYAWRKQRCDGRIVFVFTGGFFFVASFC
jgi:hypothetical protein